MSRRPIPASPLRLAADATARFTRLAGTRIRCVDGVVWVTLDGDRRDIVLDRGDAWTVDADDRVLVYALGGPALVALEAAQPAVVRAAVTRPQRTGWRAWLPAWAPGVS